VKSRPTNLLRYSLNIKGLEYTTTWVEFPDIQAVYEKHGIEAVQTWKDGSPYYCLPVIHDLKTGKTIADSLLIAHYLDEVYPHTQRLVPENTYTLHAAFMTAYSDIFSADFYALVAPRTMKQLYDRSLEWQMSRRVGSEQKELESEAIGFKSVQKDLEKVEKWYKPGQTFVSGTQDLIFADLQLAGYLIWVRSLWGEDSEEWREILTWNNGRWKALFEKLKPFEEVL